MARKPKNQPSPAIVSVLPAEKIAAMIETLNPARRGRKATAALSLPEVSSTADIQGAEPIKAPGRKAVGREPKPSASAAVAAALQDNAGGRPGPKPHKATAEATATPVDEGMQGSEALPQADDTASGDLAPPVAAPDLASEDAPALVKPAAHWDRANDTVQFDWSAIEQIASHEGANQGMAKLLVAARAEGASSRWPF